ncbi:MAG: glutamine-hydrolyzing GMP synthase [Infirmifilum sp.]
MESRESVVVFDFGGQYAHLIARRVRELNFYSQLLPYDATLDAFLRTKPSAVIFSGGPSSIYVENAPKPRAEVIRYILDKPLPLLGICYGHQLIASVFGGHVARREKGEYGLSLLRVLKKDPLFEGTPERQKVWMSHRDAVEKLPEEFETLASTDYSEVAAFKHKKLPVYGVQFHPEVRHTEYGKTILGNFLSRVAGLSPNWFVEDEAREIISRLRERLKGKVLMAVSGGVDSLTAATMILRAVGKENIYLVHINTGLLRENESQRVLETLNTLGFENVTYVDASERFLSRLRGVVDPEEKRRIIASTFAEIFREVAVKVNEKLGGFKYLAQGTIYPDRVESGATSKATAKIKSHHNVVMEAIPGLEIVEPLADFYKDEVRRVARSLGLPEEIVMQHPFPGPGLAVRIVGEVTEEKLRILRKATRIVEEELKRAGLYEKLWQAFPALFSVKTVGVKGDVRSYEYVIALRAVESEDAMTASFARIPWDILERIAERLVNEVEGVNRVLYDVTHKPPATIEYE